MNTTNFMRGGLAISLVSAFVSALATMFFVGVPDANKDLVVFMLGQLSGSMTSALGFYFGTTQSSANKDAAIKNLTDQETNTS